MVEVEILEVNRTRLKEYGIEITSGLIGGGIAGAIFPKGTIAETVRDAAGNPIFTRDRPLTLDDNPYSSSNLLITSLPGVIYRLLQDRHQLAAHRQPPAAHRRRRDRAGALRRPGAGAGHRLLAHRHRRRGPAAGHVVRVQERRREHRHHAARAPRRGRDAGAEARDLVAGPAVPEQPDLPQPDREHHHPPARRRDQRARGPDQRRGADGLLRPARPGQRPRAGPAVRPQPHGGAGDATS